MEANLGSGELMKKEAFASQASWAELDKRG